MQDGVSIVIPAWNEEARLPLTLERLLPVLEGSGLPFEVVVVADGVSDRTADAARLFASRGVVAVEFRERLGKGGAVFQGFNRCRYSRIGYLDSDGPVSDEDILQMVAALDHVDCAVGSRYNPGSVAVRDQPLRRRFLRWGFHGLTRLVLGLPMYDTQCGAKMFRAESFWEIAPRVKLRGWAFDASVLFEMKARGKRIQEIPVHWAHDRGSKLYVPKQVPVMMASILFIRLLDVQNVRNVPTRWLWALACAISGRSPADTHPYRTVPDAHDSSVRNGELDGIRSS